MRMIASVGSWMVGSGTSSTRTSLFPCQTAAFIAHSQRFSATFQARPVPTMRSRHAYGAGLFARSLEVWTDKLAYLLLMGACILLIVVAWNVVRFWLTTAAVLMSAVAAVIPPVAMIVGNWGQPRG